MRARLGDSQRQAGDRQAAGTAVPSCGLRPADARGAGGWGAQAEKAARSVRAGHPRPGRRLCGVSVRRRVRVPSAILEIDASNGVKNAFGGQCLMVTIARLTALRLVTCALRLLLRPGPARCRWFHPEGTFRGPCGSPGARSDQQLQRHWPPDWRFRPGPRPETAALFVPAASTSPAGPSSQHEPVSPGCHPFPVYTAGSVISLLQPWASLSLFQKENQCRWPAD